MSAINTKRLPVLPDAVAPDGSDVRVLLGLKGGGLAHFELSPLTTSVAVCHRTVDEIWFVLSGRGEMWRKWGEQDDIVTLEAGICVAIPAGTQFQFRSLSTEPLAVIGVTMPPWPGAHEAFTVPGKWAPTTGHRR